MQTDVRRITILLAWWVSLAIEFELPELSAWTQYLNSAPELSTWTLQVIGPTSEVFW